MRRSRSSYAACQAIQSGKIPARSHLNRSGIWFRSLSEVAAAASAGIVRSYLLFFASSGLRGAKRAGHLGACQTAPLARTQTVERECAELHALEPCDLVANALEH